MAIRVLVIGGTRFVGLLLAERLVGMGHHVTLLNRGQHPDPFGSRVERITLDRRSQAFSRALGGRTYDAAVDFAAFDAEDATRAVSALRGSVGHYVCISSGQVYLVLEGATRPGAVPTPESAYAGQVSSAPSSPHDREEWLYGVGKRAAEDILGRAYAEEGFPATCLRLPMVNGERDYHRRVDSYVWRILDGGPLLLPGGGAHPVRHVHSGAVAEAIVGLLGRGETFGEAYNLAQDELPTLRAFLTLLCELVGVRREIVDVPRERFEESGLSPELTSPFSSAWMSCLDPEKAKRRLGFTHEPLASYLGKVTQALLRERPKERPEGYGQRAQELALVR